MAAVRAPAQTYPHSTGAHGDRRCGHQQAEVQTSLGTRSASGLYLASDHGNILPRPMSEQAERLRAVYLRVEALLQQRNDLRAQLDRIGTAERQQGQRSAVLEARVAELEKENEVLRTSKPANGGEDAQGTKQRIDELVNEIDRCLMLLDDQVAVP
jgi:hypothetical protein